MKQNSTDLRARSSQAGEIATSWLILFSLCLLLFVILFLGEQFNFLYSKPANVKIGILYSHTGTMAVSEKPLVDVALLAIEEINAAGGVLGRQIEPVIADGKSDPEVVRQEIERLVKEENVDVIFACWTSACRKTIKPVVESNDILLFYVVQYEGMESSSNIVYLGTTPNQQIIPSLSWAIERGYERLFLVGSDYIFPRMANHIIRDIALARGVEIVGEEFLSLGTTEVKVVVEKISASGADLIINTINGSTNIAFYKSLRQSGIKSSELPSLSFSMSENMISAIGIPYMVGEFASNDYFQNINSEENHDFITAFRQKYGADRVLSSAMEAVYIGVNFWVRAYAKAKSTESQLIIRYIKQLTANAPQGIISIDRTSVHTFKTPRIGKLNEDGQFDIVWEHKLPVAPQPYPIIHSEEEWDAIINGLYRDWGNRWTAPTIASP